MTSLVSSVDKPIVVLVTGGTGLVGRGIEAVINEDKKANETWFFASSKDANFLDMESTKALFEKLKVCELRRHTRSQSSLVSLAHSIEASTVLHQNQLTILER